MKHLPTIVKTILIKRIFFFNREGRYIKQFLLVFYSQ